MPPLPSAQPRHAAGAPSSSGERYRQSIRRLRQKDNSTGFLGAAFGVVSTDARDLYRTGWFFMVLMTVIGVISLHDRQASLVPSLLAILVPAVVCFRLWFTQDRIGLPVLPIILVQQAVVYAIPVFGYAADMPPEYADLFFLSSALTGVFFICLYAGWRLVYPRVRAKNSRLNLSLGEGKTSNDKCLNLAFSLLGGSLLYHVLWRTGFWDALLNTGLAGIVSIIRTFSSAGAMLGALLGGIVVGKITTVGKRTIFWSFIIALAGISLIDVLLSDASRVVIAAVVGMSLGKGKPPWLLLMITFSLVGFLNQGKVDVRERYWQQGTNSTELSLPELPAFFADWAATSTRLVFGSGDHQDAAAEEEGASVFKRINNLQNTLFVVDAIQRFEKPLLNGDTYTLIPQLFIPRAVWKGKPRAHLGQAILNVHFGRQKTEEETHRVYIAWGILPEAIGNFGVYLGPVILGLVMGGMIGFLEKVSLKKRILSVEGMTLGGLLLITAGSYEMVASVLLTSTFQFLVAVSVAGFGLFIIFRGNTNPDAVIETGRRLRESEIPRKGPAPTAAIKTGPIKTCIPRPLSTMPIIPAETMPMERIPAVGSAPLVRTTPIPESTQLPRDIITPPPVWTMTEAPSAAASPSGDQAPPPSGPSPHRPAPSSQPPADS